jgi:spore germination cell wall hydrolase CwlJ-like protein
MVALRIRVPGARFAPCGLAALLFALAPTHIGHQDLAALIAQQPDVASRAREHLIASPFGTIQASVFSLPQPLGTATPMPERIMLATFDPTAPEGEGSLARETERVLRGRAIGRKSSVDVNRAAKGDLLVPRLQIDINREIVASLNPPALATAELPDADDLDAALRFKPFPEYDVSVSLELRPRVPAIAADGAESGDETASGDGEDARAVFGETRLYFDGMPMMGTFLRLEAWGPGEAPVLELPAVAEIAREAAPSSDAKPKKDALTVVAKGESADAAEGFRSPAMLLNLSGKSLAKAERCLSNAVYFEARGESVRGQVAVAQVVLNRAFSGYYPEDVCGVVYQGARRHLSCQFTFACDGIPDVVTEQEPWERAQRIAKAALDGKIWLKEVGKATHYHAYWVTPYWVRSMRRLQRIGVHSFYRPRRWGEGSDAPTWGKIANAEIAARF